MAYYSGQAESYNEILNAILTNCQNHGWILDSGFLVKNNAYFQFSTDANGVSLSAGTGISGSTLLNKSPYQVRLGRYGTQNTQPAFPMTWFLHVCENPDEIFMLVKFSVNFYYWIAFGTQAEKIWTAACCGSAVPSHANNGASIYINPLTINHGRTNQGGFFWHNGGIYNGFENKYLWNGAAWVSPNGLMVNHRTLQRLPNTWNNELVFLPVITCIDVASNKIQYVHQFTHVKYIRIDNYEPEQILLIGSEKWKVYPFYRKNTTTRDGGDGIQHSGTLGFAIKFDG